MREYTAKVCPCVRSLSADRFQLSVSGWLSQQVVSWRNFGLSTVAVLVCVRWLRELGEVSMNGRVPGVMMCLAVGWSNFGMRVHCTVTMCARRSVCARWMVGRYIGAKVVAHQHGCLNRGRVVDRLVRGGRRGALALRASVCLLGGVSVQAIAWFKVW